MLSLRKWLPYLLAAVSTCAGLMQNWRCEEHRERIEELLHHYRARFPFRRPPAAAIGAQAALFERSVLVLRRLKMRSACDRTGAGLRTPVIATTHTVCPDVIDSGVNGFIVPPGNTIALRDALTTAYEDRGDARRMATRRADAWSGTWVGGLRRRVHRGVRPCPSRARPEIEATRFDSIGESGRSQGRAVLDDGGDGGLMACNLVTASSPAGASARRPGRTRHYHRLGRPLLYAGTWVCPRPSRTLPLPNASRATRLANGQWAAIALGCSSPSSAGVDSGDPSSYSAELVDRCVGTWCGSRFPASVPSVAVPGFRAWDRSPHSM